MLDIIFEAIRLYWLQALLAVSSIALAKALADELVLRHPKCGAARLARFVMGCYIALFLYIASYYVAMLITSWTFGR